MADRRDDGDRTIGDGAHHHFFVEAPQVFDRATPACNDHYIGARNRTDRIKRGESAYGAGNLLGRTLPLHQYRPDQHLAGEAVRQSVQDIADDRTRGRRHNANHFRQEGQSLLAFAREQPFGF